MAFRDAIVESPTTVMREIMDTWSVRKEQIRIADFQVDSSHSSRGRGYFNWCNKV